MDVFTEILSGFTNHITPHVDSAFPFCGLSRMVGLNFEHVPHAHYLAPFYSCQDDCKIHAVIFAGNCPRVWKGSPWLVGSNDLSAQQ